MDELRDQIAYLLHTRTIDRALDDELYGDDIFAATEDAQAVIDALGLHHVEGTDGEWRVVSAWQDTERPF